ncbi:MAG TPA: bifunctional oligoribonuclease/PAP phosphatase NrnA [Myxococcales bacterium]|nr:bifunctional oligoribonuclease/PAP phosphatase NrnA [Myxococcales bacterium]
MKALNKLAEKVDWQPAENLPRVVDALRSARRVLLTMHRGPDGDALGSALALGNALRELGRDVTVYNPDDLPYNFRFLAGASQVVKSLPADASFDVTVSTDAGSFARLPDGVPAKPARGVLLNLDHHMTTEPFGDVNYVDPEAAAVGVLVYKIIRGLGHAVSRDSAECIYASILADTGCFRYSSTDPECLRIAAELIEAGVEPWEMTVKVYEMQPLARMKLLAEVLSTLEVKGRLATITITNEMLARTGSDLDLTDGFINYARSVDGVEVAASFREPSDGGPWHISFRSRGRVNVAAIAQAFGGGGHHNAAGCAIDGEAGAVRARISEEIERALNV